jgi:hypothetical protein
MGPAEPPADVRLTKTADTVKLSSKIFLLSADDTLHALASTAFMRMLWQEGLARVPDFAGQRVRQVSVVVQVVDGTPSRMVHSTFSTLDIKPDGSLDVERLNTQQIARLDVRFDRLGAAGEVAVGPVIEAAQRFVARGGSWEPDAPLLCRIEAAALGQVSCPRARLVR